MSDETPFSAEVGEAFGQSLLDAFPGQACIIDSLGVILAVNQAWRGFAADNGGKPEKTSGCANYLEVCEGATGEGAGVAAQVAAGIREVLSGKRPRFEIEYACHSPRERRWFLAVVSRFTLADRPCLLIGHHDISDRQRHLEAVRVDLAVQRVRNEVLQMRTDEDWLRVIEVLHPNLEQLVSFAGCGIAMVNLRDRSFYTYDVGPTGVRRGENCAFLPRSLEQVVREQVPVYRRNRRQMELWGDNLGERHSVVDVPFAGGTLALNSEYENAFSLRDMHILERFALVLTEAQQRLGQIERQAAIQRVREAVWAMEKPDDILQVLSAIQEQLPRAQISFDGVGINIIDGSREPWVVKCYTWYVTGPEWEILTSTSPVANQVMIDFWRGGKPAYRPRFDAELYRQEGWEIETLRYPIGSVVDLPFSHGTLAVNSRLPEAFSPEDIDFLQRLGEVLTEGYKRLDDLMRLERQALEAESLAAAIAAVARSTNLDEVLQRAVDNVCQLLDAGRVMLLLFDRVEGVLVPRAQVGYGEAAARMRIRPGEGLSGQVYLSGRVHAGRRLLDPPLQALSPQNQARLDLALEGGGSGLRVGVPLRLRGQIIGALVAGKLARLADQNQIRLLERLVEQAALAIERAQRLHDLEQQVEQRQSAEEEVRLSLGLERVRNEVLQMRTEADWDLVARALYQSLQELVSFAGFGITMVNLKRRTFYAYGVGSEGVQRGEVCDFLPQSLEQVVRDQVWVYRRNRREMELWGDNLSQRHAVVDVPFSGGTLALNSELENAFSHRDIQVLHRFATVLSEAHRRLQSLHAQEAVRQVREVVWRMERAGDIYRVMSVIREQLHQAEVFFDEVAVNVVETPADPRLLRYYTNKGRGADSEWGSRCEQIDTRTDLVFRFWQEGQVVYRPDLRQEDRYGEATGFLPQVCAVIDVPFSHGTLAANCREAGAFSEDDIRLLGELAAVLSEGFRRLDDLAQLEERARSLEQEIAQRHEAEAEVRLNLALQRVRNEALLMEAEADWARVVACFHRELHTLVAFDQCSIQFVDLQRQVFSTYGSATGTPDLPGKREYVPLVPSLMQVVESGQVLYRRNRAEIDAFGDRTDPEAMAIVDAPFLGGTIAMNSSVENAFSDADIHVLEQFTGVMNEAYRRLEDLMKLGQAETQLRQAQKMEAVGQLTAGIAHNFNNMLQSILLNLELIAAKAPARFQESLSEATEEGLRAAEMIRQLMIFGRQQPAERYGCFDLGVAVQNTVEICRKTFDRKISLRTLVEAGLPPALGDATQIQQVLLNLCLNARDALEAAAGSEPGIEVRAGLQPPGDGGRAMLCVEVEDNGCGMDEETRERIFEPFFTTKEVGKGTGLGLATVYAIVRDHHGMVQCRSVAGAGSVFRVLVPVGEEPLAAEGQAAAPVPRGNETVLVIDDDRGPRHSMARLLREQGYTVHEAADGGGGLEIFRREREHLRLVLLDLSMPGLSGGQVLARINAQAPELPVVLCSGYALPEGQYAGAAAVLQKPVRAAELGQVVRLALDRLSGPAAD
ncbi:MAG: GAF domain-containing protein [Candidatus Latescibacteria bacterium]|nr:GAF domain-containing protein [Candidatus Latescibacterota bacterium]